MKCTPSRPSSEKPSAAPGATSIRNRGAAPPLVLLGVDVERRAADLAESHVVDRNRQLTVLEADRGGAIAAAPGLEERQRPVGGLEATNHLESRRGRAQPPPPPS